MAESTDTRRNRIAAFFEILTRPETHPGEQDNALTALLQQDPSPEFISEAIAYVRDPAAATGTARRSRLRDDLDGLDRDILLGKIDHLQWQLDFREKHDARHVEPRLKQQSERLDYLENELGKARYKLRAYERDIAALHERLGDSEPTDLQTDNDRLRQESAAFGLENARLKGNRARKDKQIKEWRREIEFLHEYIALLKKDPAVKTPDRSWPPPSWCPTEEADPEPPRSRNCVPRSTGSSREHLSKGGTGEGRSGAADAGTHQPKTNNTGARSATAWAGTPFWGVSGPGYDAETPRPDGEAQPRQYGGAGLAY
jgi:hypothetical protein